MSLKEVFENVKLKLRADAKFSHMTTEELKEFVKGFRLCKNQACQHCHRPVHEYHDPVDYNYPG